MGCYSNRMVGQAGVEPATPRLGIWCSVHLSYWPKKSARPSYGVGGRLSSGTERVYCSRAKAQGRRGLLVSAPPLARVSTIVAGVLAATEKANTIRGDSVRHRRYLSAAVTDYRRFNSGFFEQFLVLGLASHFCRALCREPLGLALVAEGLGRQGWCKKAGALPHSAMVDKLAA